MKEQTQIAGPTGPVAGPAPVEGTVTAPSQNGFASPTAPVFDGPRPKCAERQLLRDLVTYWEAKANFRGLEQTERDLFARARFLLSR